MTGRSARTAARWHVAGIDDTACLSVLQTHAYGLLPHPAWQEWLLSADGFLHHWTGARALRFQPGHLQHQTLTYDLARDLRLERDRLRLQVDKLTCELAQQARQHTPDAAANDEVYDGPQLALAWP